MKRIFKITIILVLISISSVLIGNASWGDDPASESISSPQDTVKKGWNFISIPWEAVDGSPSTVLNGINMTNASLQTWDNANGGYLTYNINWNGPMKPGEAYWFIESGDKTITYTGYPSIDKSDPNNWVARIVDSNNQPLNQITIPAHTNAPYWITFGLPTNVRFECENVQFTVGTETVGWTDAVKTKQWIEPVAQGFDSVNQCYMNIAPSAFPQSLKSYLEPWHGYWMLIKTTQALTITFPTKLLVDFEVSEGQRFTPTGPLYINEKENYYIMNKGTGTIKSWELVGVDSDGNEYKLDADNCHWNIFGLDGKCTVVLKATDSSDAISYSEDYVFIVNNFPPEIHISQPVVYQQLSGTFNVSFTIWADNVGGDISHCYINTNLDGNDGFYADWHKRYPLLPGTHSYQFTVNADELLNGYGYSLPHTFVVTANDYVWNASTESVLFDTPCPHYLDYSYFPILCDFEGYLQQPLEWSITSDEGYGNITGDIVLGDDMYGTPVDNLILPCNSSAKFYAYGTDLDFFKDANDQEGCAFDSINSYYWQASGNGSFVLKDSSQNAIWQTPSTPGTYTLTCTIDDAGILPPGDSGTLDDPPLNITKSITIADLSLTTTKNTIMTGGVANSLHQTTLTATCTPALTGNVQFQIIGGSEDISATLSFNNV